MVEKNPSAPNVRAYPKEKKYIRSIREGEEREPDIIRRLVNLHKANVTEEKEGEKK